jgi:membrane protease YdiL (CAAX protease family)
VPAPVDLPPAPPRPLVWPVIVSFIGAFIGIQVLGAIAGIIALLVFAARNHIRFTGPAIAKLVENLIEQPRVVIASVVLSEGTLLGIALLGTRLGRAKAQDRLHLGPPLTPVLALIPMVLGTLAVSEAGDALLALTHWHASITLPMLSKAIRGSSSIEFAALLAMAGVAAPAAEEIFFRGFMQTRLVERWGRWRGILLAAACFGILHFDPIHTPLAFALGVFLGWVAEVGGSIQPSILAHGVNNWVALITARALEGSPSDRSSGVALTASLAVAGACVWVLRRVRR